MSDPELSEEVSRWLRYAREDLEVAEMVIEHEQALRAACFHAQQCAEKAIKASLIFLGTPFRKVHDLELLSQELPNDWALSKDPGRLSWLTVWAVEPRYPGALPEASEDDANTAVDQAREILETTLRDLENHGYQQNAQRARTNGEDA
jgi:HEPN domain-containing protein